MDYKKSARALKRAGFIDYDLRHNLTTGQKSAVTRLLKQHGEIIKNPDNFIKRRVAPGAIKKLKGDGYTTTKKAVYLSKENFKEVHIKTEKKKKGGREITITRRSGNKKQTTKVYTNSELLAALEREGNKDRPKNKFITVRIGDNGVFRRTFRNAGELMFYLREKFKPELKKGVTKESLISQMSFVSYDGIKESDISKFTRKKMKAAKKKGKK